MVPTCVILVAIGFASDPFLPQLGVSLSPTKANKANKEKPNEKSTATKELKRAKMDNNSDGTGDGTATTSSTWKGGKPPIITKEQIEDMISKVENGRTSVEADDYHYWDMTKTCKWLCDGNLDNWYVKGDTAKADPYPDEWEAIRWAEDAHIEVKGDKVFWSGLNNPTMAINEACAQCDNDSSKKQTCTVSISHETSETMEYTNEYTAGFEISKTAELNAEVEIKVAKLGGSISETQTFSVGVAQTTSKSVETSSQTLYTMSMDAPAHTSTCGKVSTVATSYPDATFTMNICLAGAFRCDYADRCQGSYFHYSTFDDLNMCSEFKGKLKIDLHSDATQSTADGKCPDMCSSSY